MAGGRPLFSEERDHQYRTRLQSHSWNEKPLPPIPAASPYMQGLRLWTTILALALGTLLVAIDNTIIAVAIPKISSVFNSLDEVGWYGSAYLLAVTALQPTCGRLFRFFDMKYTFLISVLVFEGRVCTIDSITSH